MEQFRDSAALMEARGSLVVRRLSALLGAERTFRRLAALLEAEADARFAAVMVQALNLILLTSAECADLRASLKAALRRSESAALFASLYPSWCRSAVAIISLCLLAQARHRSSLQARFRGSQRRCAAHCAAHCADAGVRAHQRPGRVIGRNG